MAIRELSVNTQAAYVSDLYQWFAYILQYQDNKSVLEITDSDITEFLFFCKKEGNNALRQKVRISTIRSFFKFLRKNKYMKENPTEFIDAPKKSSPIVVQTFLTSEQVAQMREKLIAYGDLQLRLYATLSLSTMARLSAIASLKWSQVDINACVICNVLEKEAKVVDIYFNDEVKQLLIQLKGYRELHNIEDYGWIFVTRKVRPEKPINSTTLYSWCKRIGAMCGVPSLHPHDFRHSGATLLCNAGMKLEDISILLNHESTDTTRKYYIKSDTARINDIKSRLNY